MTQYSWTFLSYVMSETLSAYGGGERIKINQVKSLKQKDSSNNSKISLPSHFGTHIDFPLHFSLSGKSMNNYHAEDFIFRSIKIIDLTKVNISDYLIKVEDLNRLQIVGNKETDFLMIKTGYCVYRNTRKYWEYGLGFDVGTAFFLKSNFPNLRAIGFDLMSLSSYQKRETGRKAHKEFLMENDMLIVEDVDLKSIFGKSKIKKLIVAPLRFEHAEGTPVTLMAKIRT